MHLTHIFSVACVVGSCHRTTEGRFHSVGVEHCKMQPFSVTTAELGIN